jgi:hypothetical protein
LWIFGGVVKDIRYRVDTVLETSSRKEDDTVRLMNWRKHCWKGQHVVCILVRQNHAGSAENRSNADQAQQGYKGKFEVMSDNYDRQEMCSTCQ